MPDPAPDQLLYFKRLRAHYAKPASDGVLHGDLCPKLTLHGVEFAIPPRGVRISPRFDGPSVRLDVIWPGGDLDADARRLLALAPLKREVCPRCGQAVGGRIEIDPAGGSEFLALCFSLAGRLLRRYYDLDDHRLTELLSFPADQPPAWIAELLAWSASLPAQAPSAPSIAPAGRTDHRSTQGLSRSGGFRNLLRRLLARIRG